ncbi:MAG: hypothetical protein WCY82_08385 [Desulfotomaculaceae bacterium]
MQFSIAPSVLKVFPKMCIGVVVAKDRQAPYSRCPGAWPSLR